MTDGPTLADVLAAVRRIEAKVDALGRRDGVDLGRLAAFLVAVHKYGGDEWTWTANELLAEVARDRPRALVAAVDAIVGVRGDAAIRLGRWLERHAGAEVDGLQLERVKREGGAWLYAVEMRE